MSIMNYDNHDSFLENAKFVGPDYVEKLQQKQLNASE